MDENKIKIAIEASVEQVEKAFNTIEQKMKSLLPNIDKLSKGFKGLDNDLGKIGKNNNLDNLSKSIDKVSKSINGLNANANGINKIVNALSGLKSLGNLSGIASSVADMSATMANTASLNKNTEAKDKNINKTNSFGEAQSKLTGKVEETKNKLDDLSKTNTSIKIDSSGLDKVLTSINRTKESLNGLVNSDWKLDTSKLEKQINNVEEKLKDVKPFAIVKKPDESIRNFENELGDLSKELHKTLTSINEFKSGKLFPDKETNNLNNLKEALINLIRKLPELRVQKGNFEGLDDLKRKFYGINTVLGVTKENIKNMFDASIDTGNIYDLYSALNKSIENLNSLKDKYKELTNSFNDNDLKTNVDITSLREIDNIINKIAELKAEILKLKDTNITPANVENYKNKIQEIINRYGQLKAASNVKPVGFETAPLIKSEMAIRNVIQKLAIGKETISQFTSRIRQAGSAINSSFKGKVNTVLSNRVFTDLALLKNIASSTATSVKNIFSKISTSVRNSFSKISNSEAFTKLKTKAKEVVNKIKETFNKAKVKIEPKIEQPKVLSAAKSLVSKLIAIFSAAAIGKAITSSITEAMSIVETENLFETITSSNLAEETNMVKKYGLTAEDAANKTEKFTQAQEELRNKMSSANDEAEEFINKMSKLLGLNTKNIKNDYAMFYGMANGMGLANEAATQLSKGMTMLTQDMASFYNRDAKDVTKDMQSALSGEYTTLKKYGIVINETLLKQRAYEAGMKVQNGTLTASQRVLLTYNEILRQSKNAQGDLAKTLDSPANKLRILKERLIDLKQALGKAFMPIVNVVLPLLNKLVGYLITAANAVGAFIQRLVAPFQKLKEVTIGDEIKEAGKDLADDAYDKIDANEALKDSYGGVSEGIDEMGNAIEDAGKKAKGQLAAFDKINDITPSKDTNDNGTNTGIDGVDLSGFDINAEPLEEGADFADKFGESIDKLIEKIKPLIDYMKKLRDLFKEGFKIGFVNTDALDNIKKSLKDIYNNLKEIATDPEVLAAGQRFAEAFMLNLGKVVGSVASIASSIAESFFNGLNAAIESKKDYIKEKLISIFDIKTDIANSIGNIATMLANLYNESEVTKAMDKFFQSMWEALITGFYELREGVLNVAKGIIGGIELAIEEKYDFIKEKLVSMFNIGSEIFAVFEETFSFLGDMMDVIGGEAGQRLISAIAQGIIVLGGNLAELCLKLGRDMLRLITEPFTNNKEIFVSAFESTLDTLGKIVETFVDIFEDIGERVHKFYDEYVKPFVDKVIEALTSLIGTIVSAWEKYVLPVIEELVEWFGMMWDQYLGPFFSSLLEFIGTVANAVMDLWNAYIGPFINWLIETLLPIVMPIIETIGKVAMTIIGAVIGILGNLLDILSGIIDFLVGVFTGDWEQAWRGIEKIVDGVVGVIGDLFNGLWDLLCAGFEGVYKFIGGIFEGIGNLISNVVDWMIKRFQDGLNSIKRAWSGLKSWFSDLFNGICDVFRNVGRKIGDAVSGAFKAVINGALNMVEKTINSGIKLINNAIWVINKIPGVNISKISLVSFPRLARGGIVDGPRTVTVGEQGKEAIVPLENTAFVTILANAISDGIAKKLNVNNNNQNVGPINVHLDLDGRTFGKVAIDNINKYQDLAGRTLLRF